jgi:hypothetical protein
MGPDDHRHSGERAAYGSQGQRCSWRAEFPSAMSLRAFARFYRKRPMRQPGQKTVPFFMLRGGVWRAHTRHRLVPSAGLHALDFPQVSMTRPATGRGDGGCCLLFHNPHPQRGGPRAGVSDVEDKTASQKLIPHPFQSLVIFLKNSIPHFQTCLIIPPVCINPERRPWTGP